MVFFLIKSEKDLPLAISIYSRLKHKRKREFLTKEEEIELSCYEASDVFEPAMRNNKLYWIGFSVFMIAFTYHSYQLFPKEVFRFLF